MSQPIDGEPQPRVFGNKELAALYLDDRISHAFTGQTDVDPREDLRTCAAVLGDETNSFPIKIIDMMPMGQLEPYLQEQGFSQMRVDSGGLRIELASQLGAFLALPAEAQAIRLGELGIATINIRAS